jgi:hypothetical protein
VTPSPNCAVPDIESNPPPADPVLAAAVDIARAAATEEAGPEPVGRHVGVQPETGGAATHLFEADYPGYGGWRWAVTVASAGPGMYVTVSEVVLLPGPDALVAPDWVPWQQRVQAGDLGVGDLMPTEPGDPRLVPGYLESEDPAIEAVARETGLGRVRVMSRFGRLDSAERWQSGDFGPQSEMARSAPDHCGRCGFYLPLAGSLQAAFGVCGNELAPADGRVVHAEYGCGAHSEVELESSSPVPVADLVYDDTTMDMEGPLTERTAPAEEPAVAETTVVVEEAPAVGETPAEEDAPVAEAAPAVEEAVAEQDTPAAEEIAVAEEALVTDEAPVVADAPAADVAPVAEQDTPAAEEIAVAEEALVTDEAPVVADEDDASAPVAEDDTSAAEAAAVAEGMPVVEDAPAEQDTPVTGQAPAAGDSPVAGETPAAGAPAADTDD